MMEVREEVTDSAALDAGETWELCLYVAGHTTKSVAALANLRRYCEQHVPGRYQLDVVDLLQHPQLAREHQIVAVPAVVRKTLPPGCQVIGDLSNEERVLTGLALCPTRR
jgi:circadian clock protein KaiB